MLNNNQTEVNQYTKEFFVCYSPKLFRYLKIQNNTDYIVCGLHESIHNKFWLFKRTNELSDLLTQYKKLNTD